MVRKTIVDKILDELRKGNPLSKIRGKYHSHSALTTAKLTQLLKQPHEKRPKYLNHLLTEERDLQVNQILKMPDAWPSWFKENTENQISFKVQRRLDQTFWAKVRKGVEEVKRVEWQPYLNNYTRDVITPLIQNMTMIKFIQEISNQTFQMDCPRCGAITPVKLTSDDIANLFKGMSLTVNCKTPQCKGLVIHTRYSYTLGTLIMFFTKPPTMPKHSRDYYWTKK